MLFLTNRLLIAELFPAKHETLVQIQILTKTVKIKIYSPPDSN